MTQQPTFPYGNIIASAFAYLWAEKGEFFRMAMLPVIGLSLVLLALEVAFPEPNVVIDAEKQLITQVSPKIFIALFVQAIFYSMFSVAWHRKWLVPDEDITYGNALRWDQRKTRFLFRLIAIFFVACAGGLPVAFGLSVLNQIGILPGFFVIASLFIVGGLIVARVCLWLPAAAVDDPMTMGECWAATDKNSWRMLTVWMGPAIPVTIGGFIIALILVSLTSAIGLYPGLVGYLLLTLVSQGINYFGIAVGISAISMAYQFFKQNPAREDPEA